MACHTRTRKNKKNHIKIKNDIHYRIIMLEERNNKSKLKDLKLLHVVVCYFGVFFSHRIQFLPRMFHCGACTLCNLLRRFGNAEPSR